MFAHCQRTSQTCYQVRITRTSHCLLKAKEYQYTGLFWHPAVSISGVYELHNIWLDLIGYSVPKHCDLFCVFWTGLYCTVDFQKVCKMR